MNERDIRLILTQKCNYRCTFCHHEGVAHDIFQTLNNDDYLFLYDTVRQQQHVQDVTLTGGEPLMHPNIENLSKFLHDRGAKITMVTNGSLLHKHPEIGKWLDKINISLHSLDQGQYNDITQTKGKLEQILHNIKLIRKLYPDLVIRLNTTVVKGRNDNKEDISAFIDIADKYDLSIKFVELYPNTEPDFIPLETIKPILEELGFQKSQEKPRHIIYSRGKLNLILTKFFCGLTGKEKNIIAPKDNDIFVSPDGLVSPYPSSENKISLYDAIKKKDGKEIARLLQQAIDGVDTSTTCQKILD